MGIRNQLEEQDGTPYSTLAASQIAEHSCDPSIEG